MSELLNFSYQSNPVRIVEIDGQPWFVAKDVCRILEVEDASKALERLDEDEKGTNSIRTPGGSQQMLVVSESGLYALIFTSRKPEAKAFRKWVTSEVLPAIRKNGGYTMPGTVPSPESEVIAELRETNKLLRQMAGPGAHKVSLPDTSTEHWSEEELRTVQRMWMDGFGVRAIATMLETNTRTIYRILDHLRQAKRVFL